MSVEIKAVVTVSEMAKMVGLSRSRFHQLIVAGVFPSPSYLLSNRRPVFVRCQQEKCLEVRRKNVGVDGQPVLFYARKSKGRRSTPEPKRGSLTNHVDILAGVKGLGLSSVNVAQVDQAVKAAFPSGSAGVDQGEIIRSVFLHLVRQTRATV